MKMTLSRKILLGFAACTAILIAVACFSYRNSEKFIDTRQWVDHTHEVLTELSSLTTATVDAETGVRGYVISGSESFLASYQLTEQRIKGQLKNLQELTRDNPIQQKNLADLQYEIDRHYTYFEGLIAVRKEDAAKAIQIVSSQEGKLIQDKIRKIVDSTSDTEKDLLTKRKKISDADAAGFNFIFTLLLIVIGLVLIGVYLIIKTNLTALAKAEQESAGKNWLLSGSFELNEKTRGQRELAELAQSIIDQLCSYLEASIGALYLFENDVLHLSASYAFDATQPRVKIIQLGEGLVGQSALQKKMLLVTNVPGDYMKINSGLGSSSPKNLVLIPLLQDKTLKGIIEIGSIKEFSKLDIEFLNLVSENLAIVFNAAQARTKLKLLLEETQRQADQLEMQQEELKQSNEELQEQTNLLEKSDAELRAQQEELQQTNAELEEKANLLEEQKEQLEIAKISIENKARELGLSGRYKSEFLANMSHELRTPLNSILILSQLLSENKNNILGSKEVEFATYIHNSGMDLLNLINEILDLSKIEAGKIELDIDECSIAEIKSDISAMFSEIATNRSIKFGLHYDETDFSTLVTDKQRLEQILKNFLSNAFKFTDKGGEVTLSISSASPATSYQNQALHDTTGIIAFSVSDTGIGIPEEKLEIIFQAFQQADGSTKRKYGGTGLGLSISRELANALGGEIGVKSIAGEGSTFTLYLPQQFNAGALEVSAERKVEVKEKTGELINQQPEVEKFPMPAGEVDDDRDTIGENDRVILIMEDDREFAWILLRFVNERHFKGIIALQGNTGLSYARHYKPDAILLDMKLPVMDGAEVLKHLKNDPEMRHIPVQIISGYDRKKESMELGAFDFIQKPVKKDELKMIFDKMEDFINKKLKKLLIVEDNDLQNKAIRELIGNGDVKSFSAYSGREAYEIMVRENFDCVIVDLGLPDMSGFTLLEKMKSDKQINKVPVIVYTGKDLSKDENKRLNKLANTVVLKTVDSHERLLDETMLFLHRIEARLPKEKQKIIRKLHRTEEVLKNKKVLVVDDDIRNIFSLTNALEEEGMICLTAENGKIALKVLEENPSIEIVLMDVMMPEMDGYEATIEIRNNSQYSKLPIIALTAKAMKGDREKCLQVGMSDYISKPVNVGQLLSLMRVWLYR